MDAKSKANFINAVAAGTDISCSKCGARNRSDCKYCISCGEEIIRPKENASSEPVFEAVKESVAPAKVDRYIEPNSVFAEGLPEWTVEPPQVIVRRH